MNNELSDLVHRTKEQRIAYKGAKNSVGISPDVKNQLIEDCIRHGRSTTLIEQKYSIAQFEFLKAQKKLMDEFPDYKPPLKDMPLEFRCQIVNHYPSADKRVTNNDNDPK